MSRGLKSIGLFLAVVVIFSLSHHRLSRNVTTTTNLSTTTTTLTSTCLPGDLKAVMLPGQGAAGTIYAQWVLTKTSGPDCLLYGYPLVTYQNSVGALLPVRLIHVARGVNYFADSAANAHPQIVRMKIGSVATLDLSYSDVQTDNTGCPTVDAISLQVHSGESPVTVMSPNNGSTFAPCNGKTLISPYF
jgi:hypothetical protein